MIVKDGRVLVPENAGLGSHVLTSYCTFEYSQRNFVCIFVPIVFFFAEVFYLIMSSEYSAILVRSKGSHKNSKDSILL